MKAGIVVTTYHRRGEHSAICHRTGVSIGPEPTEIDLVRALKRSGIALCKLASEYHAGAGYDNTIYWFQGEVNRRRRDR